MGREVRQVPRWWNHPKDKHGRYIPMHEKFPYNAKEIAQGIKEGWLDPKRSDYGLNVMPQWAKNYRKYLQMYETCTEGTPISPVMKDAESLARWLSDNKVSAFGDMTATYDQWLAMIHKGSSWGSAMLIGGKLISGVEAASKCTP